MALESFTKQNWESFLVAADLSDVLDSGDTATTTGSEVLAEDKNGADAASEVLDGSPLVVDSEDGTTDGALAIRVKAGSEAKSPYKLTYRVATVDGDQWEVDVRMKIKET